MSDPSVTVPAELAAGFLRVASNQADTASGLLRVALLHAQSENNMAEARLAEAHAASIRVDIERRQQQAAERVYGDLMGALLPLAEIGAQFFARLLTRTDDGGEDGGGDGQPGDEPPAPEPKTTPVAEA